MIRLSIVLTLAVLAAVATPAHAGQPSGLQTFTSDSSGFDTHSFWWDTGRQVVVFDAQFTPELARKLIAEIRSKTASPIAFVVITHPNPDKFNGASAFHAAGAKVVASKATASALPGVHAYKKYYFVNVAKMFTEATYPAMPTVDVTFEGRLELPLEGGAHVELSELKHAGVSSTQTVAYIPALRALVVGDLVHYKAHAWLEGGIVDGKPHPDVTSWVQALMELTNEKEFAGSTVYGGRGKPAALETAVAEQIGYLMLIEDIVRQYILDLGARKSELSGPNAGLHYKALSQRAAEAFPDYELPYMIEYGVYGLVNSLLQAK